MKSSPLTRRDAFWSGFAVFGLLHSLTEDAFGVDGWTAFERQHWISGWWTIPLALVLLAITALGWWAALDMEREAIKPGDK